MSDSLQRIQQDAAARVPQPFAEAIEVARPEQTLKYLLTIGLVIGGAIATILWLALLRIVVYLILTH
jgi:hypothetical protein